MISCSRYTFFLKGLKLFTRIALEGGSKTIARSSTKTNQCKQIWSVANRAGSRGVLRYVGLGWSGSFAILGTYVGKYLHREEG